MMSGQKANENGSASKFSALAIFNSAFRFTTVVFACFWSLIRGIPNARERFDVFGLELPHITEFFIAVSVSTIHYWFVVLPMLFFASFVCELIILFIPQGAFRRNANIALWTALMLIAVLGIYAFAVPLIETMNNSEY